MSQTKYDKNQTFTNNEEEKEITPQNYFLIIPSHLISDKRLDDSTRILFGIISSLSNKHGYCFASDKYLGELTNTGHRQIARRIKLLDDLGYIRRETEKVGMFWDRKIIPNFNYEASRKTPRDVKSDIHDTSRMTTDKDKNYKEKKDRKEAKEKPPFLSVCPHIQELKITQKLKEKLTREIAEEEKRLLLVKRIKRWRQRLSDTHGVNVILKHWDSWEDSLTMEELKTQNCEFLDKLKKYDDKKINGHSICIGQRNGDRYIEFVCGYRVDEFFTSERDFIKELSEYLRERLKMEI